MDLVEGGVCLQVVGILLPLTVTELALVNDHLCRFKVSKTTVPSMNLSKETHILHRKFIVDSLKNNRITDEIKYSINSFHFALIKMT